MRYLSIVLSLLLVPAIAVAQGKLTPRPLDPIAADTFARAVEGSAVVRALVEKHGYAPLPRAVKEQIFGLNAARVFGVDVNAARHEIPKDYVSRIKMSSLEDGPVPSHRWYGWVTR